MVFLNSNCRRISPIPIFFSGFAFETLKAATFFFFEVKSSQDMASMALKVSVPVSFLNLLILLLPSTQTNTTTMKSDETCNWRDQNKWKYLLIYCLVYLWESVSVCLFL